MKTAVILAAREEKNSAIPYPLLPIEEGRDFSIMDRNLELLHEFGFDNIVIVVGYKAELFEKYASENVRLVVNEDYKFTSSMTSLAMVKPFVDEDFVIVESDTIFEKRVLAELIASKGKNCFTIVMETGNGDEAFVETDGDFVLKRSKDIHQINRIDGEMAGVTKLSYETFLKMLDKLDCNSNPILIIEFGI